MWCLQLYYGHNVIFMPTFLPLILTLSSNIEIWHWWWKHVLLSNSLLWENWSWGVFFFNFFTYFSACTVILRWRLHFEFVTAREPLEPPTVLQNQSEVTVWTGAENVDVDTFSWDLPIKVLPTNPALASYMSHFTGTNSINIWLLYGRAYDVWILCF